MPRPKKLTKRLVANRVNNFLEELDSKTGFFLHQVEMLDQTERKHLRKFITTLTETERYDDFNKTFTAYTDEVDMFTNDMITSALYQLEPNDGVVICSLDIGLNLLGVANIFNNSEAEKLDKRLVSQFQEVFNAKLYSGKVDIEVLIIPICIDGNHYGVICLKRSTTSDGKERRTMWWGDSLGYKCPKGLLDVFKLSCDVAYGKGAACCFSSENFMLDVHKYQKQEDGYSCGAYVISVCAEYAKTLGVIPDVTYKERYSSVHTSRFRWASFYSRIRSIIDTTTCGGIEDPSEIEVREFERANRERMYKLRHGNIHIDEHDKCDKINTKVPKNLEYNNGTATEHLENHSLQNVTSQEHREHCNEIPSAALANIDSTLEGKGQSQFVSTVAEKNQMRTPTEQLQRDSTTENQLTDITLPTISYIDSCLPTADQLQLDSSFQPQFDNTSPISPSKFGSFARELLNDASKKEGSQACLFTQNLLTNETGTEFPPHCASRDVKNKNAVQDLSSFINEILSNIISDATKGIVTGEIPSVLKDDDIILKNNFWFPFKLPDDIGEKAIMVHDFARFGAYMAHDGYAFILHFCRVLKKSKKYDYSARIRCSNFKSGCKSGFIGKKLKDEECWEVTGKKDHDCNGWIRREELCGTHAVQMWQQQEKDAECNSRFQSLTCSIANQLPLTERISFLTKSRCPISPRLVELKTNNGIYKAKLRYVSDKNAYFPTTERLDRENCDLDSSKVPATAEDRDFQAKIRADIEEIADSESEYPLSPKPLSGPRSDTPPINEMVYLEDDEVAMLDEFVDGDAEHATSLYGVEKLEKVLGHAPDNSRSMAPPNKDPIPPSTLNDIWVGQGDSMRYTIDGYVSSLPEDAPGVDVLQQVKHLSETFGYYIKVRSSQYWDNRKEEQSLRIDSKRVLKYGCLECNGTKHNGRSCFFQLIIKSVPINKPGEYNDVPTRKLSTNASFKYYCDLKCAFHQHNGTKSQLKQYIPVDMLREARHLVNNVEMKFMDVLRYVEEKYGMVIDKDLLRKQLFYLKNSDTPRDKECLKLCESLMLLGREDKNNEVFFTSKEDATMHSAAWALAEWRKDYSSFGIIPGISIDCKAIANRFGLPLITINGRTNSGHVCTYFMGFLADQTEESFKWLLQQFRKVIPISPSMIYIDQDVALISAIRSVLPNSSICLDDWHVNKNLMKNVSAWCRSINRPESYRSLSNQLFLLRNSTTITNFTARRDDLERTFFYMNQRNPPQWYKFLYRDNPQMICSCYKDSHSPRRFLFQGTGYSEASNSSFRSHVLGKKTRIPDVPFEMKRITALRRRDRQAEAPKILETMRKKVKEMGLGILEEELDYLVHNYTPYCIRKFIELSAKASSYYTVVETKFAQLDQVEESLEDDIAGREYSVDSDTTVCIFVIKHRGSGDSNEGSQLSFYQVCMFRQKSEQHDSDSIRCFCTCRKATVNGFPCRHIIRVLLIFPEESIRIPQLTNVIGNRVALRSLWHPYWRKDHADWNVPHIAALRASFAQKNEKMLETFDGDLEENEDDATNVRSSARPEISEDFFHHRSYANGKNLYDQMHRLASSYGQQGVEGLMKFQQWGLDMLSKGGNLGNLHLHKKRNFVQWLDGNNSTLQRSHVQQSGIRNPNPGSVGNQKRKRSFFEGKSRKTRKKVEGKVPKKGKTNTEKT